MKKVLLLFSLLVSQHVFGLQNFSVKCETSHSKKNKIDFKVKADFEMGHTQQALSDIVSEAEIKIHIKGQLNKKEVYNENFSLKGHYRKVTDDEVAFDEQISAKNKKIKMTYLFISDKQGAMTLQVDEILKGGDHLSCDVSQIETI